MHRVKLTLCQHAHLNDANYLMRIGIAHGQRIATDRAEIVAANIAAIDHIATRAIFERAPRKRGIAKTRSRIDRSPIAKKRGSGIIAGHEQGVTTIARTVESRETGWANSLPGSRIATSRIGQSTVDRPHHRLPHGEIE